MRGESQAFNNYNKKIIKKLTNSNATFPPPQSDGLTAGRGCNISEFNIKTKPKTSQPLEQPTLSMTFHMRLEQAAKCQPFVENTMDFLGF